MDIKKYNMSELVYDNIAGEFYKAEDVEQLLNEKFQINKLDLNENDILIIRPPEGKHWTIKRAKAYHDIVTNTLEKSNLNNDVLVFIENVHLDVLVTHKSNYANGGE